MAEILFLDVNQLVWLDETGSDNRDRIHKFGYSLKGEPPIYNRILHRGGRISAICAMSTDSLLAYTFMKGTVNGEKFLEFIQGTLVPLVKLTYQLTLYIDFPARRYSRSMSSMFTLWGFS